MDLLKDANKIIEASINSALPDNAVRQALSSLPNIKGKLFCVSIGKAAWQMANAAYKELEGKIHKGIVITKYGHAKGKIGNLEIFEAGHPVPDKNTYLATSKVIDLVDNLSKDDLVLFLISGGGSALFEKPLISEGEMESITKELLKSGADIVSMNMIRKRLSAVKGGKFAKLCQPARAFSVVLSDIIGDPLDMIASGPAYPDSSTKEDAEEVIKKYGLKLSLEAKKCLEEETPKSLDNVEVRITGSVSELCKAAQLKAQELGYQTIILTDSLSCQAKEAGSFLGAIAKFQTKNKKKIAFIAGGETIVKVRGNGKGGRNQELALAAAKEISGLKNVLIFSMGSDGTDGPTDAAGGIVTGETKNILDSLGIDIDDVLNRNDAYNALIKTNGLIFTGPTGTNVNDLSCLLIG